MSFDFQTIVDGINSVACIMSAEVLENGRRGKFRLIAGNKPYIDSVENPAMDLQLEKKVFVPNSEYTDYIPRDLNMEDYCWKAAVEKKNLHAYVQPGRYPGWFNLNFIPLSYQEGNIHYCLYTMEIENQADPANMINTTGDLDSQILEICIKIRGSNNFRSTMEVVINDIRELCDAEHCCILTMNQQKRSCAVFCEALSYDTPLAPMGKYLDSSFYDIADSWEATLAGSNCLIIKDEQDMEVLKERNPVWQESLVMAGAHSIVMFPLKFRDQLLGYIWAINFNAENAIKIKETLELTTFILGSEFGNYFLLDKLKVLSSKDMLTGVMNRNEMNIFVDNLSQGQTEEKESVGVLFADLNGLKGVNDKGGHTAGDLYLRKAAQCLMDVFDEEEIFRAGGDEFSIIVTGITASQLAGKLEEVRQNSKKYEDVSFALGSAFSDDSRDIRKALREADQAMYEDKKRYYQAHPEIVRSGR